jgi:tetratricopeptide (TPR) repeat protein
MKRFTAVFILLFCATISSSFVFSGVGDAYGKQFYVDESKMDKKIDSKNWYYKGLALKIVDKQFQKAIDAFTKSIELDPNYIPCYYERADLYEKMGKWEEALRDYNKMLELDPYFQAAYFNRGRAYSKLGDHEKAVKDFKTAAKLGYLPAEIVLKSEGGHSSKPEGSH